MGGSPYGFVPDRHEGRGASNTRESCRGGGCFPPARFRRNDRRRAVRGPFSKPSRRHQRCAGPRRRLAAVDLVARTSMIPLWARAAASMKGRPLVHDLRMLEICASLDFDFSTFRQAYGTQISFVPYALYHRSVEDFLALHPEGTVVELGAGLTTRFKRVDNGRARWIDVDMPDAMALRRRHVEPSGRRIFRGDSALDPSWPQGGPSIRVGAVLLLVRRNDDVPVAKSRSRAHDPNRRRLSARRPHLRFHVTRRRPPSKYQDSMTHMLDASVQWGVGDAKTSKRGSLGSACARARSDRARRRISLCWSRPSPFQSAWTILRGNPALVRECVLREPVRFLTTLQRPDHSKKGDPRNRGGVRRPSNPTFGLRPACPRGP